MLNREKLARLEASADAASASISALFATYREHVDAGRRARSAAMSNAPDAQHLTVPQLNDLDPVEREILGVDADALRLANLEMTTAHELRARADAAAAAARPLVTLITNLRRYANEGFTLAD